MLKKIMNMDFSPEGTSITLTLSKSLYPKEAINAASGSMSAKAKINLGEDNKENYIVKLEPKGRNLGLEAIGREFSNELINKSFSREAEKNEEQESSIVADAIKKYQIALKKSSINRNISRIQTNLEELKHASIENPLLISTLWGENP